MSQGKVTPLTSYQFSIIILFVLILFTIVVDYMTLPALSAILLSELQISTQQFGFLVSVYAFSAGGSAFLATGFADRFDRKKLLFVYFAGFVLGMLLCATAYSLTQLIVARIITGIFGGVVASICFAIAADLFEKDQRGRVMGYIQIAFAASLLLGLPLALYLSTNFNWHFTYWIFFTFGLLLLLVLAYTLKPIKAHLNTLHKNNVLNHSVNIVKSRDYWTVFLNNVFLVLGDTMFMTFGSAYSTNNLGVSLIDLPILYGIGGFATIVFSPVIGHLSDRYGQFKIFMVGTVITITLVAIYTHLKTVPFWLVALLHTLLFIGINIRMIASTSLTTVVPKKTDRGAFMALDSSFQQVAGGIAATAAGWIVFQASDGLIHGYPTLGWVIIGVMLITLGLMYTIHRMVKTKR